MADFSPAQFQAIVNNNEHMLSSLRDQKLPELVSASKELLENENIPLPVASVAEIEVGQIADTVESAIADLVKISKASVIPELMYKYKGGWLKVQETASSVEDSIQPARVTPLDWGGAASDAYSFAISGQDQAAAAMSTVARRLAASLEACANCSQAFYSAVSDLLSQFIQAVNDAQQAVETLISLSAAPASLPDVPISELKGAVEKIALALEIFNLAKVQFQECIDEQETSINNLSFSPGESSDAFPDGRWPKAATDVISQEKPPTRGSV